MLRVASCVCSAPQTCSQRAHAFVGDPVVDVRAVLAPDDHAGVDEYRQVLRQVLLARPKLVGERSDAHFPIAQQVERSNA